MDNPRIIHAPMNRRRYAETSPITQYDYGYLLLPEGVELPTIYEIDFSNDEKNGTSLTVYGNSEGAEVPEELIRTGKDVYAFYYHVGDGYGKTEFTWKLPNKCRPSRDGQTPTPTQQSSIDQLIVRSNETVTSAEQSASAAGQSAQSASEDADRAERARTGAETAQGKAEDAQESAERAKDDAEASERNASESERKAKGYAETASEKADSIHSMTASAQTLPDGSSATASYDAETGVMTFGIPKGKDGRDGTDGDDGYSPSASVTKSGKVATITITDKNGTTSAQVEDGTDGTDGVSPTVTITPITGGHRITITDADGEHSADVMDGQTPAVPVDDVQINGTSIVTDGVAEIPISGDGKAGVVKALVDRGTVMFGQSLVIYPAQSSGVKAGTNPFWPLTPSKQHESTFYGLAKAAGSDEKNSTLPVGEYTESAKSAISEMLGGSVSVSGTTPTIVAKSGIRYVCGELATLDFTPSQTGICDVVFTSGSTATVLTITGTVKWANGFDPTALEANTTYELNIMDGLGVAVGWT